MATRRRRAKSIPGRQDDTWLAKLWDFAQPAVRSKRQPEGFKPLDHRNGTRFTIFMDSQIEQPIEDEREGLL